MHQYSKSTLSLVSSEQPKITGFDSFPQRYTLTFWNSPAACQAFHFGRRSVSSKASAAETPIAHRAHPSSRVHDAASEIASAQIHLAVASIGRPLHDVPIIVMSDRIPFVHLVGSSWSKSTPGSSTHMRGLFPSAILATSATLRAIRSTALGITTLAYISTRCVAGLVSRSISLAASIHHLTLA